MQAGCAGRDRSNIGKVVSLSLHVWILFCVVCLTPMSFPRPPVCFAVHFLPKNPRLPPISNPFSSEDHHPKAIRLVLDKSPRLLMPS
jgi:hypothetical protein